MKRLKNNLPDRKYMIFHIERAYQEHIVMARSRHIPKQISDLIGFQRRATGHRG